MRDSLYYQVTSTLGDHTGDYDVNSIVEALKSAGVLESIDELDGERYWEIVNRYDRSA